MNKTIIFLHVPKAAGTTLRHFIQKNYRSDEMYWISSSDPSLSQAALINYPLEKKQKLKFIGGHLSFGLHEYIPSNCSYFTLLREPVDRVISLYYFIKNIKSDPRHTEVSKMSLCGFVKSGITVEVDNGQTRLISGIDFLHGYSGTYQAIHFGKCGQNVLEVAKNNLDNHFDLVGILEKFGQSLYLLRHFYGWRKSFC